MGKTVLLDNFRSLLDQQIQRLQPLSVYTLKSMDPESHGELIRTSFDCLNCEGVGATGSSKILHLINPKLFVMWDAYIRGEKTKKDYKTLLTDVTITNYRMTGCRLHSSLSDCKACLSFWIVGQRRQRRTDRYEANYNYTTIADAQSSKERGREKRKKRRRAKKR